MEAAQWMAVGPRWSLEVLVPLWNEHRRRGAAVLLPGDVHDVERVASKLESDHATLLVIEDPTRPSARVAYDSPFLQRADGSKVLLGFLRLDARDLATYARRAAAILARRSEPEQTVVLLGPREPRYLALLDELERTAESSHELKAFRWSAERIRRAPLIAALKLGAAAVLYTGHGNADGWSARGGLSAHALAGADDRLADQVSALLFSLSCHTGRPAAATVAGPFATQAFADRMIASGAAGAVFAPHDDPLHVDNRVLANALVRAIGNGRRRLRDILDAVRREEAPLRGYNVIGDPGLCAVAAPGAARQAASVFAPAADADLTQRARHVSGELSLIHDT
jgi:hypothetical protein